MWAWPKNFARASRAMISKAPPMFNIFLRLCLIDAGSISVGMAGYNVRKGCGQLCSCALSLVLPFKAQNWLFFDVFKGRLYSTEWNGGMERWNGTMEWNGGMEWNDHAYIIVYFRNGRLPRCAHAQQMDLLPAAAYKERL